MDEEVFQQAISNPQNLGEMADADAIGTVGSPDCGDMVRMWLKYKEKDGRKVIDKASFQSFGCQTAIAVASMATQMILGKTREEAARLSAEQLSSPLGPLPPMKIHCGQMVEGALKAALENDPDTIPQKTAEPELQTSAQTQTESQPSPVIAPTLHDALAAADKKVGKIKIVPIS